MGNMRSVILSSMPTSTDQEQRTEESLLDEMSEHYLTSLDFNGLPVRAIGGPSEHIMSLVKRLVTSGRVDVVFGDTHPNPHIKAFDPGPIDTQMEKIERLGLTEACLYPSPTYLEEVVDDAQYDGLPFTAKLALGEPQLSHYSFDLRVLEQYRRDPRYYYWCDDISGRVSVSSKHYESDEMRDADKVLLESFGFAYSERMERAVAVFLRYLYRLSPEHQQVWSTHLLAGEHHLHPDYLRSSLGDWALGVSAFEAFMEEIRQINKLTGIIWQVPLFRHEYRDSERPKHFSLLIRPTLAEFNDFVLVLDKMISDNLNHRFLKRRVITDDARNKGSIAMLEEWLRSTVRFHDSEFVDQMFLVLKNVRSMRQRPAHAIEEDEFDQSYFQKQRWLIAGAYSAVRTLRMIFQLHPDTKTYTVPAFLSGHIWLY